MCWCNRWLQGYLRWGSICTIFWLIIGLVCGPSKFWITGADWWRWWGKVIWRWGKVWSWTLVAVLSRFWWRWWQIIKSSCKRQRLHSSHITSMCNKCQQDRQCSYNVTFRYIHASTGAMEKAINITYSDYAFVDLDIQHAMCMCHTVTCGPTRSTLFFHIIS